MKLKFAVLLVILGFLLPVKPVSAVTSEIYVDFDNGNDISGDGTIESPYYTLERARQQVRILNQNMQNDIYVNISGSRSFLEQTILLDERDCGNNGYKVIYRGIGEQKPKISGGKKIVGWSLHDEKKNIYKAPSNGIKTWQLNVNGENAVLARSKGGLSNQTTDEDGKSGVYTTDTFLKDYKHIKDLVLVFAPQFVNPRVSVTDIEEKGDRILLWLKQPYWSEIGRPTSHIRGREVIYYENAYELLDEPGEFYLDVHENMFYYIPREGENMDSADVVAPVLEELIKVSGFSIESPAKDIVFENLHFTDTTWTYLMDNGGYADNQNMYLLNDWIPAALTFLRTHNAKVEKCVFSQLGATGLIVDYGAKNFVINGNEFWDIAGGGAVLGRTYLGGTHNYSVSRVNDKRYLIENISFTNNYIHHVSHTYRSYCPVTIGWVSNSDFSHNEIGYVPYSGFHIGWGWGYLPTSDLKQITVKNNYIHDIMSVLYDGGAIYVLGPTGGTQADNTLSIISENYIKNQYNNFAPLYSDNGTKGLLWKNNVIDNSKSTWNRMFALVNSDGSDVFYENNYTTTSLYQLASNKLNSWVKNTKVYENANWPEEALAIIQKSGLEPEYEYMAEKNRNGKIENVIYSPKDLLLDIGEYSKPDFKYLKEKGKELTSDEILTIKYASSNTNVFTVDETGIMYGKAAGKARLYIHIQTQIEDYYTAFDIYVGDQFESIVFKNGFTSFIVKGETREISAIPKTKFGGVLSSANLTFSSSNPDIIEVVDNTIIAKNYGTANIICEIELDGIKYSDSYTMRVIDFGNPDGLGKPEFRMDKITSSIGDWHLVGDAEIENDSEGIRVLSPTTNHSVATFIGEKYKDELFTATISFGSMGGWGGFMIRAQEEGTYPGDHNSTYYLFGIQKDAFELQRFVNGTRTTIYSNAGGENIGIRKTAPNNKVVEPNTKYKIQVGAFNEGNGVRLILNVDDKNVLYFLDDTDARIENEGYFGIVGVGDFVSINPKY